MISKNRNKAFSTNFSPVLQSLKKEDMHDFKLIGSKAQGEKLETFNFIPKSKIHTPFSGKSRTSP